MWVRIRNSKNMPNQCSTNLFVESLNFIFLVHPEQTSEHKKNLSVPQHTRKQNIYNEASHNQPVCIT